MDKPLDLEHFLPYRLSVLTNHISQGIARTYEQRFGLSVTEWRIIAILGRYPGLSATEIAQRSAMDKVAISRAVRRLVDAGRVEREHSNEDRRARHLWLSDEGRRIHDRIVPAALEFEHRLRDLLSMEENRLLDRLIDKLEAGL
ncbi:MAG: MarR family transcriptional regulator [Wenzhouxiangellaceae bacterium]|nr:MarR family transcriptional regulator [Wenzhouxiangellaceae bacterium]